MPSGGRDRFRPGADQRPVLAHRHRAHLRGAARLRLPGPAVQAEAVTAEAMPEVSDDFRTFTFRLRPGIYFADDPAFGGKPRELMAEDYVYTFKRIYDPQDKSPGLASSRTRDHRPARAAQRRGDARRQVRLRQRDRGPAGARPLHGADQAGRAAAALSLHLGRPPTSSASSPAKWSRSTATRSWSTRSAPARSGWRNGGAARGSCSCATRTSARSATTAEPNADDAEGQALARG